MAVVEELVALLGFKVSGQGDLAKWKKGLRDGEDQAKRSAVAMGRIGEGTRGAVLGVGRLGAAIGVAGAGVLAKQAITGFADFERRMSRIGIAAGASVAETDAVGESLRSMSSKFALPVDQARAGLETLVATGMNLRQAMGFMPALMVATQASGAEMTDLASTAQTIGTSFKITSGEMQDAFDILITGGNAGKFELKDMARYIPDLASRFSSFGYKGTEGLKSLVAVLQTLRERTGSAETANVQAQNLFSKIYSDKTIKNFKSKGIDLRSELEKSKKAGEDFFVAFGRLTKQALKGDYSHITDLFDDQELQAAATTLGQAGDSLKRYIDILNGADVKGSGLIAAKRIMDDTTSSIQRAENSYLRFLNVIGKAGAPATSKSLDYASGAVEKQELAAEIRRKNGAGAIAQGFGWLLENPDDVIKAEAERNAATYRQRQLRSMLNRPSRSGGRTEFGSAVPNTRTSGAFSAFPNAGSPGAEAGSLSSATAALRLGMPSASLGADTSAFAASMSGVQGVLRDFSSSSATVKIDADTSAAEAKLNALGARINQLSAGGISASGATPQPPRNNEARP